MIGTNKALLLLKLASTMKPFRLLIRLYLLIQAMQMLGATKAPLSIVTAKTMIFMISFL